MIIFRTGSILRELTPESFSFDYARTVPIPAIIAMVAALVISLAVPVLLFLYLRKRFRLDPQAMLYGIFAYLLGRSLLPTLMDLGLQYIDARTGLFSSMPAVYYAIGSAVTVLLEFAAVLFGLKLAARRTRISFGLCVYFGLFFSIMPILTQTVSYMGNYLSVSLSINQGNLRGIVEEMIAGGSTSEDIEGLLSGLTSLMDQSVFYYLLLALDVLLMIPVHICLSVLTGGRLSGDIPKNSILEIVIILAVYAAALLGRSLIESETIAIFVGFFLITALVSCFLTWRVLKEFMPQDLEKLLGPPDPSISDKGGKNHPGNGGHKMPKIVMPKD